MPDQRSQAVVQSGKFKNSMLNSASSVKYDTTHSQMLYTRNGTQPWVEIVEQPMAKGQRFRYRCEGRSAGSLPGESSTLEKKTYPAIFIHNFSGNAAIVVVSCVTKDSPYRPHPHNLVGQDCKDGVCTLRVKGPGPIVFSNIGIQCCKRHDIIESLRTRAKIRVDPYATGIPEDSNTIDLNAVRLCFQVFLPDANKKFTCVVDPVVSQPIIDKKTIHDLVICRLSRQSGYAQGGDEVFLLCDKVVKDDIQVRFYQETEDGVCWEAFGEFTAQDIHRQFAIVFKTPPYKDLNIQTTVPVYIQLRRPSDDECGDPKPFQYIPNDTDPYGIFRKRKRSHDSISNHIPVFADIKGNDTYPSFSNDVKTRLKKKAENSLQKKERIVPYGSVSITEANSRETSFGSVHGGSSLSFATSTGGLMCEEGRGSEQGASFMSMLGMGGNTQQLALTPITGATGQSVGGNFMQYLQYTMHSPQSAPFLVTDFSNVSDTQSAIDGTANAEECIMDALTDDGTN